MKKYEVLLKKDTGKEQVVIIEAANENDARWDGKKRKNVYEAVVLRRVKEVPEHLQMIGEMIKKVRLSKELNQTQLAEAAGLRVATISDVESGKANLQINTLSQIASALNCYLDISLTPASEK